MTRHVLISKFLGALIGAGIGDALGTLFEGWRRVEPRQIKTAAGRPQILTYTDDTHMMIGVTESLIRSRGFDGEDMARTFIQNYELEPFNSVPTAIYSFPIQPNSFAEAVLYAISLGGDTDTIGAMTGAISGAYLGIESIPDNWKSKLENRLYIQELAEKLWNLKWTGGNDS